MCCLIVIIVIMTMIIIIIIIVIIIVIIIIILVGRPVDAQDGAPLALTLLDYSIVCYVRLTQIMLHNPTTTTTTTTTTTNNNNNNDNTDDDNTNSTYNSHNKPARGCAGQGPARPFRYDV